MSGNWATRSTLVSQDLSKLWVDKDPTIVTHEPLQREASEIQLLGILSRSCQDSGRIEDQSLHV